MTNKFNVGQEVFVVKEDFLTLGTIDTIFLSDSAPSYTIKYDEDDYEEDEIFLDRLDAITNWLTINNIEIRSSVTKVEFDTIIEQL